MGYRIGGKPLNFSFQDPLSRKRSLCFSCIVNVGNPALIFNILKMIQPLKRTLNWGKSLHRLMVSLILTVMIGFWATPALATGIYQMPSLSSGSTTWVVDDGEILSRSTEGRLNNTLSDLAKETNYEVRLVTLRRLDYGETIDSFTEKLFKKWFPTAEEAANQVLLVLDLAKNNSGIQAGEQVKSLLPDDVAESVAQETLQYPIRHGDKYNEAFVAASDRLATILSGKPDPGAPKQEDNINVESTFKSAEETNDTSATIIVVVLLVIATIVPMATYYYFQGTRT